MVGVSILVWLGFGLVLGLGYGCCWGVVRVGVWLED